ncbi:HTH_Tnp_Tc3_2 domain-containing protein [Trichonephila clavipes]|nr:HTH_Tnp_Tc3_2 domain-containing protein [Trichonephila clavipes]
MVGGQNSRDWTNCKGQLVFIVIGERRIRRILRSQRSQTLAQITTQLNDGSSHTVSKRTVQHSLHPMGFRSRRPLRILLFNALYRAKRLA